MGEKEGYGDLTVQEIKEWAEEGSSLTGYWHRSRGMGGETTNKHQKLCAQLSEAGRTVGEAEALERLTFMVKYRS